MAKVDERYAEELYRQYDPMAAGLVTCVCCGESYQIGDHTAAVGQTPDGQPISVMQVHTCPVCKGIQGICGDFAMGCLVDTTVLADDPEDLALLASFDIVYHAQEGPYRLHGFYRTDTREQTQCG